MPIASSVVIEDSPQIDGRRYVTYRFTWSEGLERHVHKLVDAGFDAAADAASQVAALEAQEAKAELGQAFSLFVAGVDLDTQTWTLNSLNDVRRYCLKRLLNLLRAEATNEAKALIVSRVLPYINKFTDVQIANLINAPNWTAPKVSVARTKLTNLATALANVDHGEPEFEDVL